MSAQVDEPMPPVTRLSSLIASLIFLSGCSVYEASRPLTQSEVTQEQYEHLMGENPSYFTGSALPVEQVNWWDAIAFANAASLSAGLTPCYGADHRGDVTWDEEHRCEGYRLPTEHEWEVAARAEDDLEYAGSDSPSEVSWFEGNSDFITHDVSQKSPNGWGIFDMSGNVYEWTWDYYGADRWRTGVQTNPTGPTEGSTRVIRGGSYRTPVRFLHSSARASLLQDRPTHYVGIRLARTLP